MTSTREQVLVRLATLCHVDGVGRVTRNDEVVGEETGDRPLVQIWDGNEVANPDDNPQARALGQPRRVTMSPHIFVMIGENITTAGTSLNVLLARLQKAIMTDATLTGILSKGGGRGGNIDYVGLGDPMFPQGRTAEGEILVHFNFHYYLRPNDL